MLVEQLSFRSPQSGLVPLTKLEDKYPLIVWAREAGLLADALERALAAGPGGWPELSGPRLAAGN